jgi:phospholipid-transporting ATPase
MWYNIWFQNFMSLLYTALPVILLAVWDQDVPHYMAERIPELYLRFLNQQVFNIKVFWRWAFEALFEAIIIFAVPVLGTSHYEHQTIEGMGGISFAALICVVSLKIFIHAHTWNYIQMSVLWISFFAFFGTASWWGLSTPAMLIDYGVTYWVWDTFPTVMFTVCAACVCAACVCAAVCVCRFALLCIAHHCSPSFLLSVSITQVDFWACCALIVVLALMKDIVWKVYSRAWMPKPYHIVQEVCVLHPENEQALLDFFKQAREENTKVQLEEVITRTHAAKSMSTKELIDMTTRMSQQKEIGSPLKKR